jgi:aminoglycoside phosphotransferase (APT) family kinase protein
VVATTTEGLLDLAAVAASLRAFGCDPRDPLTAHQITGGRSNLTYFLTDTIGCRWVLRRPPLGHVMATAHDVVREARVLQALSGVVPVPVVVGTGQDADGVAFYVMDEVPGRVVRTSADADTLAPAARAACGRALMEGLARLHAVAPEAVGLGSFGRGTEYLQRQIGAWQRMGDQYRTEPFPAADAIRDRLLADAPEQEHVTLVHGDYRLDNILIGDDGSLAAILDWELCTRGDPYVDLAVCLYYWTEPTDPLHPFPDPPTVMDAFLTREQLLAEYVAAGGRRPARLGYYLGYAAWRLALVLEGVLGRFASGAYGESDPQEEQRLQRVVKLLVAHAGELLDAEGGDGGR